MKLELQRCLVREWLPEDVDGLVRNADSRNVWINLRDRFPNPYTPEDARAWIAYKAAQSPPRQFAIVVGGEAAGGIGLELGDDVHRRSAEIGFWLGEAFWGRGIMSEVVPAVTSHAFASFDLCRIHAAVFEWNPASARVLEKAGYRFEGRLRKSVTKAGRTIDQLLYAVVRDTEG